MLNYISVIFSFSTDSGIIAATVLSLSRAFGETMAVLMVCGNIQVILRSFFDACYPLPALIENNYGEMLSMPGYESALMFIDTGHNFEETLEFRDNLAR